jgi:methionine biosynthesis protein MetW
MTELARLDHRVIADRVPHGSRVLDLGCGDGTLIAYLREKKGAFVRGVELDPDDIATCLSKGLSVIQADLDRGLAAFEDDSFDVVILAQMVQVLRDPRVALRETMRVGRTGIVSFPNFAHWQVRSYLGFRGRMPVNSAIPYAWYDTPNIHHTTLTDFRGFCESNGARVVDEVALDRNGIVRVLPNLRAESAVLVLERR